MTDIIPYSSIKIDVDPKQYFTLLKNFFKINNREGCQRIIEDSFIRNPEKEKLIVSLSVRTAWDLFLQVCDYPPGSEIIMTSINIPDMARVAREHGYLVVPINVKFDDLAPCPEEFEKAINPRTKAVMLSYVYGTKFPVEEIIKIAKKHNIFIIEDIAEAFRSTDDNGHPKTDMSLFSYGTIKHNTALAGAITVIRNNEILYRKMKAIQDQYPIWARTTYFTKILKNSIPAIMLNSPFINYHGRVISRALDFDYKEYTVGLVRGFPKDADFLPKFRFQVNNVLMANLAMRMKSFDNKQFQYLIDRIKAGQDILVKGGVEVVGYKAPDRSFWLFPIVVPDIPLCYKMLNEVGVDAYLGATQLKVLEVPEGYKYKPLTETTKYFDQILYLPLGTNVPADEVERICNRTVEVLNKVRAMKNLPTPKL